MKAKTEVALDIKTQIPVLETFYSIQGEGFHQGKSSFFVRLAGCDVGCHWCDVKESWDVNTDEIRELEHVIEEAKKFPTNLAVVTGGEPLMYNMNPLTQSFKNVGFKTHLETSGAYNLTGSWDWICFSPKKFKKPLNDIFKHADELKIIVFNNSDFKWAEENALKVSQDCKLYLQPEWGAAEKMLPQIIEFIKSNPQWELSLQIHKYLNIP